MTVQLAKDTFEKLIWDSRLDPTGKLVALAIRWHLNHKSGEAFVGIRRLSYMVGRDERTIRRSLKDIGRVLGVDIVSAPGRVNTFRLRVFRTAEEISNLLLAEEWKGSQWLLFRPTELDDLIRRFGAAVRGEKHDQIDIPLTPMSGLSPVSGVTPMSRESCHPCHPTPDTHVSHNTILTSSLTSHGASAPKRGANGARQGSAGPAPRAPEKTAIGFENFIAAYRATMRAQEGKGRATDRAETMPEAKARRLWDKLSPEEAARAQAYIPTLARKERSFMVNANTYLENRPWRAAAAAPDRKEDARALYLNILVEHITKGEWPQEARDHWGSPPGANGSRVPPDLWQEAQELARRKRSMNGAGGYHA